MGESETLLVPFQLVTPMYYTYVSHSELDNGWYTGATSDLKARFSDHAQGRVRATRATALAACLL